LRSLDLDKAKEMSAKSVELDPYNSSNLDTYAWVLYKMEDFDLALQWINKAYNNGGENSGAILEHYGDILFKLGKVSEANEYWLRAKETTGYSDYLDKKIKMQEIYE
jgi:tetratricopeptide (TPR) repeat protein